MDHVQSSCRAVLEKLYLYLDGEIAGGSCREIETHMQACLSCAKRLGFERELKAVIAQRCRGQAPPELVERIRAALGR